MDQKYDPRAIREEGLYKRRDIVFGNSVENIVHISLGQEERPQQQYLPSATIMPMQADNGTSFTRMSAREITALYERATQQDRQWLERNASGLLPRQIQLDFS